MSDENRLLKRLRNNTVKYIRDPQTGKIIGIEDPAAQFRVTSAGTMQPGPQGAQGIQGPQGEQGPAGERGPAGADGKDGKDGAPGIAGTNGKDGVDGATGPAGPAGSQGKDGERGVQGIKGDRGEAGAQGVNGLTGPVGATGAIGPQGPAGATGPQGATGPAGADGKRIETYTGKTDANGLFSVTYATPFPTIPSVQPEPPAMANQVWVKVSATTTGFSLRLVQRNVVSLLGIEVLLGATVNVNAGDARVVVIAQ